MKGVIQKGELVFVRLLLPLILGIALVFVLPPNQWFYYAGIALAVLLLMLIWSSIIYYQQHKIYLRRWKPGLLVHLLLFFIGFTLAAHSDQLLNADHFSKRKHDGLVVAINSEPKLSGDILRFEAKIRQGLSGNKFVPQSGLLLVALKLRSFKSTYEYGDELLISGYVTEVEPPYNPYEFDYRNFLANRGIHHQIFINESEVQSLNRNTGNSIIAYALALRKSMVAKYDQYIHNKEAASVASTLILGYKAELSREVLSAYSKTGTMHVLSVSGMHVGIVFFILNWLLWFMNGTKAMRLARASIIIALIWFYALVTGFSPSVCRAALMLSIYVFGKAVNRSSNSYNLVASSAVILLVYNPYSLLDVGFQLSYLAVLGLIYFYPKMYNLFYISNWLGDKIWSYVALSCAAQLATFPLAMFYFHQFPMYFLVSNLLIVLPVIVIMYVGIAFLFIPFDGILKFLGGLLEQCIISMDEALFYIERLPYASYSSFDTNFLIYFSMYLLIGSLILAVQYQSKRLLYCFFAILFFCVGYQSVSSFIKHKHKSILFFSLRKNTAFSFFADNRAYVYSDLDSANKTLAFSVYGAVDAASNQSRYCQLSKHNPSEVVLSDGNFFVFNNWRLLIWNKAFETKAFSKQIEVDAVLLSGKPKIELSTLVKFARFKVLLIDGTNLDYMIKKWVDEAKSLSLNVYVLKKNPAYSIPLNN